MRAIDRSRPFFEHLLDVAGIMANELGGDLWDTAIGELDRRKLKWAWVEGEGDARLQSALAAIQAAGFSE